MFIPNYKVIFTTVQLKNLSPAQPRGAKPRQTPLPNRCQNQRYSEDIYIHPTSALDSCNSISKDANSLTHVWADF